MGDAAEYIERLEAMAEGSGQTWDLSDNDRTAIKFILEEFDRLHGEINSLRADAARLDWLCGGGMLQYAGYMTCKGNGQSPREVIDAAASEVKEATWAAK